MSHHPILYSFRRCPYAMRARMALLLKRITVELREVDLRNKPPIMLEISPKGTVPILLLQDGTLIDESLDIIQWAMDEKLCATTLKLIATNDSDFKHWLDRYKYADRFPEQSIDTYREHGEVFLQTLESRLATQRFLLSAQPSVVDFALFPFIRQFVNVDNSWFENAPYPHLRAWLNGWLESDLFAQAMEKFDVWSPGDDPIIFAAHNKTNLAD